MKHNVKRWAAMAVLALGVMSAQANAASVGVNFSSSGVQVVVKDDHKHAKQHKKAVKKHAQVKKVKHHREMDRHRLAVRRHDNRSRQCCKGKR